MSIACLHVCPLAAFLKNHVSKRHEIFYTCMAVARSSSDNSKIRYVLPVLVDYVAVSHNGPCGQN